MLEYCDYLAAQARKAISNDPDGMMRQVGHVKMDLHPTQGYLQSTKKTIEAEDVFGQKYRVTVETVDA